jgi:hypothetical protein
MVHRPMVCERDRMKTLIFLLAVISIAACVDTDDPIESEATSSVLSYCRSQEGTAWHVDDYTGQCCTNGYFVDDANQQVCCPPDTKAVSDSYATGGWSCESTTSAYTGVEGNPVGSEGNNYVRRTQTNYWYTKAEWQKWGYPVFKFRAGAIDLPPATTSTGERCGTITRVYRDGTRHVVYYKYCGSTYYYRYSNTLFDIPWSSLSVSGFTYQ